MKSSDEEIFSAVITLPDDERLASLQRYCGDDPATLERVRALIDGYEKNSAFLEVPPSPQGAASENDSSSPHEPQPGEQIGPYRLISKIGEGGFGVVFRAEQTSPLRRSVALKLIRVGLDTREFLARFAVERQALARMDHPNIARVFDAGTTETGRPYLVMELVSGRSITRHCDDHAVSVRERLELFLGVCAALQHAHQKGVIHRDLKPSNILVTSDPSGVLAPKLIDFGIAKAIDEPLTDCSIVTQHHTLIGTPAYSSPEQVDTSGRVADTRSDIYSLGALLYELLTGTPPFDRGELEQAGLEGTRRIVREVDPPRPSARLADFAPAECAAVASRRQTDASRLIASMRGDLDCIVMHCLEKNPSRRYESAGALAADLHRYLDRRPILAQPPTIRYRLGKFVDRHRVGCRAAAAMVGIVATALMVAVIESRQANRAEMTAAVARTLAADQAQRLEKTRWAREKALPEIERLLRKNDITAAFALGSQAEPLLHDDPAFSSLWAQISCTFAVDTTPAGADVYLKPYDKPAAEWQYLGKSPVKDIRLSRAPHRWRIERAGYTPVQKTDGLPWALDVRRLTCTLYPIAATPPGMVRVDEHDSPIPSWPAHLDGYWIDQHEVTNAAFKEFVARGGYATEKFWTVPFVFDGKSLSSSEAMARFRDRTGQPGPATWTNGTYPDGQANHPVTGVSWYEAAAYAAFVGKRLPTTTHWKQAASPVGSVGGGYMLAFANFGPNGTAPVGASAGISWCGAVDLAGNAKEWCCNEGPEGTRLLLGGGWGELDYTFMRSDRRSPFDRDARNGFRCIKIDEGKSVFEEFVARVDPVKWRDYGSEKPVSDDVFEVLKRQYVYDHANLDARQENAPVETPSWRRERVSFAAAYGGQRMEALIYYPRLARRPYQAIVFFPGSGAQWQRSSEVPRDNPVIEALLGTGRTVVYPVLSGTYERGPRPSTGQIGRREWLVHVVQDVRRTLDYLETRDDFASGQVAYIGLSWGAEWGPIVTAVESRFRANVFIGGGLRQSKELDEVDPFNFAPRVTAPTLMINGRQDSLFPYDVSSEPLFRALALPPARKRHVLVDGGHLIPVPTAIAEIRTWLDQHLGPLDEAEKH